MGIVRQKINSLERISSGALYYGAGRTFDACLEGDPFGIQKHPERRDQELLPDKFDELRQNDDDDVIGKPSLVFPMPGIDTYLERKEL